MARLRNKRGEISKENRLLYRELEDLVKVANKRLSAIKSLTGKTESFATKELYDYLGSSMVKSINEKGLINLRKDYKKMQLVALKRTINNFLKEKSSRVSEIKKLRAEYSEKLGVEIDYSMSSTYFAIRNNYEWIYEYIPKSEFWGDYVPLVKREQFTSEDFIEDMRTRIIDRKIDEQLRNDLVGLYLYVTSE